jgi:hypothetical protein
MRRMKKKMERVIWPSRKGVSEIEERTIELLIASRYYILNGFKSLRHESSKVSHPFGCVAIQGDQGQIRV